MKLKRFLFTLLIGMISFAGLRAETPDLKENSTDTMELTSNDEASSIASIVSNDHEIQFIQIQQLRMNLSSGQIGLLEDKCLGNPSPQNIQFIREFRTYKQFRKPRDGFRCIYKNVI